MFDQKWNESIFTNAIKPGRKEKSADPGFRLFPLSPGPEDKILSAHVVDCPLAPICTGKVSAGYKAAPVCGIVARIGNPNGVSVWILSSHSPHEGRINEVPFIGPQGALGHQGFVNV